LGGIHETWHQHRQLCAPRGTKQIRAAGVEAEKAGWDGFFMWDHIYPYSEKIKKVADPWIVLAAIAASTESI